MSRRIVSWRISEPRVSPAVSNASRHSRGSVVSINSITPDMMPTDVTGVHAAEFGAKLTNWPQAGDANPSTVESFVQHDIYFFKDGNITFLVDGTLYCVHRYFFSRDSVYFSTKFSQLDVREHESLTTIISLSDVECKDFEAFLSVLYPKDFEEHGLSYGQWKSVLHLSTRWGFVSLRKLALKSIYPPTSFDRLLLARTYSVDHWVLPALSALCKRTKPISIKEARQMATEDVVLLATVREEICRRPFLDATEIKGRIEAVQASMAAHLVDGGDSAADLESEADEKESLKEAVTSTGAKADSYNGTKNTSVPTPPKTVDGHGSTSSEHSTEIAKDSPSELLAVKKGSKAASKAKASRLGSKTGEKAGANIPPSAPIASDSEGKYVSDATPKEDDENRPTPNPRVHSNKPATRTAMSSPVMGVPAEGSSSAPIKYSRRSPPTIGRSSPSFWT